MTAFRFYVLLTVHLYIIL